MSGLGEFMKAARRRIRMPDGRWMTQEDLAEQTGLSSGTIGQIENGRTQRPERETLERIAAALRVTYNDLAIAADMADPPTERDIEHEIRRIAALPTIEARMGELRQLSPGMFDLVQGWAMELVRRAGGLQKEDSTQAQQGQLPDQSSKPGDGHRGW